MPDLYGHRGVREGIGREGDRMPLTMTEEREAKIRFSVNCDYDYGDAERMSGEGQELLAELDAERAAHQQTRDALRDREEELDRLNHIALPKFQKHRERLEEACAELKQRLAQSQEVAGKMAEALHMMVGWYGGLHFNKCPEDDTCVCDGKEMNATVNAALKLYAAHRPTEAKGKKASEPKEGMK